MTIRETPSNAVVSVQDSKSRLELLLSVFADVRSGEALTVLLLTLDVLLLLVAYYVLKTVREPLILAGGGAELKSYASAGQAVVLVGVVRGYAVLTKRYSRMALITFTTLFFASNLMLFFVLARAKVPYLGVAFFLWLGCFSLTVIAQFWSFANDIYTPEQGKRLFAIVGVGSSVGAAVGSYVARALTQFGPYNMMPVAAGVLLVCLLLTRIVNAREIHRVAGGAPRDDKPPGGKNGFSIVLGDRYLMLIALVILLLNWVTSNGEYILDRSILSAAERQIASTTPADVLLTREAHEVLVEAFVQKFRGDFFMWVNIVGVGVQLFAVSRVFKYFGLRGALFVFPVISLVGYAAIGVVSVLGVVRMARIAESSCDGSLYNTVKQVVWLPTSREAKYNAKTAVDTFVVRAGDVLSGGIVALGALLGLKTEHFAFLNIVLAGGWIVLVVLLRREPRLHAGGAGQSGAAAVTEVEPKLEGEPSAE